MMLFEPLATTRMLLHALNVVCLCVIDPSLSLRSDFPASMKARQEPQSQQHIGTLEFKIHSTFLSPGTGNEGRKASIQSGGHLTLCPGEEPDTNVEILCISGL